MNQEIKQEWVAALRSGKYQQGQGLLRTKDNRFCCLGVLCDVVKPRLNADWEQSGSYITFMGGIVGLPTEVVDFVNLSWPQTDILIRMNDANGKVFAEIADYIEKEL